jgi:site-specific DNA recombinase
MSLHRPALTQIRELAQQGVIQAIIVYDQDRLSRKLAHQFLLNEEFEKTGVSVYVLSMPMTGKTPEAQLFSNMRGVFAE